MLQIVYKFTINLTKTSILFQILRFIREKIYIRITYALMVYVVGYAIASIIASTLQCTPVAGAWDKSIKSNCINLNAFWFANAAFNISSDFLILLLPMPTIRKLQATRRTKIGLVAVFSFGGL